MLLYGNEVGRSQAGHNNADCRDNPGAGPRRQAGVANEQHSHNCGVRGVGSFDGCPQGS